jgi:hypothetical protein
MLEIMAWNRKPRGHGLAEEEAARVLADHERRKRLIAPPVQAMLTPPRYAKRQGCAARP